MSSSLGILGLLPFGALADGLPASEQSAASDSRAPLEFTMPSNMENRGESGDVEGGGNRDEECFATDEPLTAIVPFEEVSRSKTIVWALTTEASPSFWFYIPYPAEAIEGGRFRLWDEQSYYDEDAKPMYRGNVTVTQTPGIVRLQPEVTLEPGQKYQWDFHLDLACEDATSATVSGWVERETLTIPPSIASGEANPIDRVRFYAEHGIWHETISLLAEYYQDTFAQPWKELLGDSDIDRANLVGQPIQQCCTLVESAAFEE
ncbi:MAG: DUF928 domain-containing protein [Cyanobacteriota bacterium]|nr:DUF928 domain-containing protein [Cyanobacteriota bacterium]